MSARRWPKSQRVSSDSHGKLPRYAKTQWSCYATHLAMAQQRRNITRRVNFHSLLSCSGGCRKVQVLGSCEKPSLVNAVITHCGKSKQYMLSPLSTLQNMLLKTRSSSYHLHQASKTNQSKTTTCHSRNQNYNIHIPLWGPKPEPSGTHQKSSFLYLDFCRKVYQILY